MSYLIDKTNEYFLQSNVNTNIAKQGARHIMQKAKEKAEQERQRTAAEKAKAESRATLETQTALQKVKEEKDKALQAERDRRERDLQQLAGKKKQAELDLQARRRNCLNDYLRQVKQSAVLLPPFSTKTTDKWLALDDKEIPSWDMVKRQQSSRICLPTLLLGEMTAGGTTLPLYIPWQESGQEKRANLYIRYTNDTEEEVASNLHNAVITRILAAFPVGKVHLTFINTNANSYGNKWLWSKMTENEYIKKAGNKDLVTERLTQVLLNGQSEYTEMESAHSQLKRLKQHVIDVQKLFVPPVRTLVQHNRQKECIEQAYEVVVLYDPFKGQTNTSYMETLSWLISDGYKGGIHFVILQNDSNNTLKGDENQPKEAQLLKTLKEQSYTIDCGRYHCTLDNGTTFISTAESDAPCDLFPSVDRLLKQHSLVNACFENMDRTLATELQQGEMEREAERRKEEEARKIAQQQAEEARLIAEQKAKEARNAPVSQWLSNMYEQDGAKEGLRAPIGISNGQPVQFVLDDQHAHSFITGQTGSGKSVLLEDIIVSMTTKYSPSDLQLYLIDFKQGATFSHYAYLPHTRWCVATEDKAILYMMLDEIKAELYRRNRNMGSGSLGHIPHIVVIFDEFTKIFTQSDKDLQSGNKDDLQNVLNATLADIAERGRSAKIHLVMASQTLDKVPLSELISQTKSNSYVFNGAVDISFCDNVHETKNYLSKHSLTCAHREGAGIEYIEPYFLPTQKDDNLKERSKDKTDRLVNAIIDKAKQQWHGEVGKQCVFPTDKTPVEYDYRPASYTTPYNFELGTDIFGAVTGIENSGAAGHNILIYGRTYDESREVTMRVMFSLMRSPLQRLGAKGQQTYVVNFWDNGEKCSGRGTKELYNLQRQGMIQLYDTSEQEIGLLLLQLLDEMDRREQWNEMNKGEKPNHTPIYLYICNFKGNCILSSSDVIPINAPIDTKPSIVNSGGKKDYAKNGEARFGNKATPKSKSVSYLDALNLLLEKGRKNNIFIILNITEENTRLNIDAFQYSIFQKDAYVSSTAYTGMFSIRKLPKEPNEAQVIFYDKSKADENSARLVVPFLLPNEKKTNK